MRTADSERRPPLPARRVSREPHTCLKGRTRILASCVQRFEPSAELRTRGERVEMLTEQGTAAHVASLARLTALTLGRQTRS